MTAKSSQLLTPTHIHGWVRRDRGGHSDRTFGQVIENEWGRVSRCQQRRCPDVVRVRCAADRHGYARKRGALGVHHFDGKRAKAEETDVMFRLLALCDLRRRLAGETKH